MNNIKVFMCSAIAFFGQTIANALGGWNPTLKMLVCFMVVDFVSGITVAAIFKNSPKTETGTLSSAACLQGVIKKVGELCVLWICCLIDNAMGSTALRPAGILFLCGSEGISILENFGKMGVPYPKQIANALEVMHDQNTTETDKKL